MEKGGFVYIVANVKRTVVYVGVTSSLYWRIQEHKAGKGSAFTSKYNCVDLVYYEFHSNIIEAITREKRIKKWKREWKDNLIKSMNPELIDLSEQVVDMI